MADTGVGSHASLVTVFYIYMENTLPQIKYKTKTIMTMKTT